MRALIRVDLHPDGQFPLKADRQNYNKRIIELFEELGYDQRKPTPHSREEDDLFYQLRQAGGIYSFEPKQANNDGSESRSDAVTARSLDNADGTLAKGTLGDTNATVVEDQEALMESEEVTEVFGDLPNALFKQTEMEHLVMIGYIDQGQSYFVVSSINRCELHVRIRNGVWSLLQRSCRDFCDKVRRKSKKCSRLGLLTSNSPETDRQTNPRPMRWTLLRIIGVLATWLKERLWSQEGAPKSYMMVERVIEVIEPHRSTATIHGEIIDDPFRELWRQSKNEVVLFLVAFFLFIALLISAPVLAPWLQPWLQYIADSIGINIPYTVKYVQDGIERVYSAFLVTSIITGLDLLSQVIGLFKDKPIRWNDAFKAHYRK